jgi:hypothetical protein
VYDLPCARHGPRQAGLSGVKTEGRMLPPTRTRRCSSRSTVSSGATPSSSLVDMRRRSSAASPDHDPGPPPPAPNVAFIPPATGAVSASTTPRSTRRKACSFLCPMLFVSFSSGASCNASQLWFRLVMHSPPAYKGGVVLGGSHACEPISM